MSETAFARNAPKKVKAGFTMMKIASVLFFFLAALEIVVFILYLLGASDSFKADWSDWLSVLRVVWLPLYTILIIASGIAGFSYARGSGPLLSFASLAAMVIGVVSVVDFILVIQELVRALNHGASGDAWLKFLFDLLDIQLFGTFYFIGWLFTKDYLE